MTNLFSERCGYAGPRDALQYECMDDALRIGIYNVLYSFLGEYSRNSNQEDICKRIWSELWHFSLSQFPPRYLFYSKLESVITQNIWFETYDLIEFVAQWFKKKYHMSAKFNYDTANNSVCDVSLKYYSQVINEVLEREKSGYRLIDGYIEALTNDEEISELEDNLRLPDRFSGAKTHITSALEHFSKRPEADYRNTIKEAILAVESAAKVIAEDDKATLAQALDKLAKEYDTHPALIEGWKKIYGFSSDRDGIRHALTKDETGADFALAKFLLVSCSAFVNYLVEISLYKKDV